MASDHNPGADATGLIQSMRANTPDSLLRAENIGALIRKFIAGGLNALGNYAEGRISRGLSIATAQANCNYYAEILCGEIASSYTIDGTWFPKGLASFLRGELGVTGDDRAVIAEGWAQIILRVFEISEIVDEEEARKAVDDLVRTSVMRLSGIK